jgi:hypothetical protein
VRTIALVDHTKKHPLPARVLEAIAEALTIQVLCAHAFVAPSVTGDEDGSPAAVADGLEVCASRRMITEG